MSANKHTPGPWMKSTHGGISKYSIWSSNGQHIADTNTTKSIGFDTCAANARLIAAAPEMLEALKWAVENPNDDAYWIEQARAAIAKATGEPQ